MHESPLMTSCWPNDQYMALGILGHDQYMALYKFYEISKGHVLVMT
jgi:hypothetical protein